MNTDVVLTQNRSRSLALGVGLLLVLFCLTAFLAYFIRKVDASSSLGADVRMVLPEQVLSWKGERIYYCQSEQCAKSFLANEVTVSNVCPVCEGRLDLVSLGERTILPPDTIISRRLFKNDQGESITVTIVLSGNEQRSIHRPQQCLPAQGFSIEHSSTINVPLNNRMPLKLTLIRARRAGAATANQAEMLMAYWFAGGGHETHDHFQRMAFMAWDNLIHGIRPRWAYVSLQTSSNAGGTLAERRLIEFVSQLYPLLKPETPVIQ